MMRLGDIEITPLAAESLGTRSLCTHVVTPDISILLDPSVALAKRYNLEPHPTEYLALKNSLAAIKNVAAESDVLSVSHYHYDHVRPGLENQLYNLSTKNERREMFAGKIVLTKDNRENINPSQRRRGFYFEKDIKDEVAKIEWADDRSFKFNNTKVTYSPPLPHGPMDSRLGYVLATIIEYSGDRFMFAPDVQGPIVQDTLQYILSVAPDMLIVGGPPIYLSMFTEKEREIARNSLIVLASTIPTLVIDHHLMRDKSWKEWMSPVLNSSEKTDNKVLTMAELAETNNLPLEAERGDRYRTDPPSEKFMKWTQATEEFKLKHPPPVLDLVG
jgi:predicted metallo-beta-lactamase superfamily hydrolase